MSSSFLITDPDRNKRLIAHHRLQKEREERRLKSVIAIKIAVAAITLLGGSVFSLLVSISWCNNGPVIPTVLPKQAPRKFPPIVITETETATTLPAFRDLLANLENKRTTKYIGKSRHGGFNSAMNLDDRLDK